MLFRTEVKVEKAAFELLPAERMLFVGSCFADNLGKRFVENRFPATVNPYGVMYNPASILHTVEKWEANPAPRIAVFTLGTNHVYVLKETGEIVDNCQKRPQRLFEERELTVDECCGYLSQAIDILQSRYQKSASGTDLGFQVIVTVSPIRYAKYGYHESMLSKAVLHLATAQLQRKYPLVVSYFPAYEIVNDELRDYRFYQEDMLHPSSQAVDYIWEKFRSAYFGKAAERFLEEWRPIKEALGHRPFNPDSEEYQKFLANAQKKEQQFNEKYFKR